MVQVRRVMRELGKALSAAGASTDIKAALATAAAAAAAAATPSGGNSSGDGSSSGGEEALVAGCVRDVVATHPRFPELFGAYGFMLTPSTAGGTGCVHHFDTQLLVVP